jgi:antitoxin Phd
MQTTLPATAWRLQDAKAQFSALVESAVRGVPQHVTRRGKEAVVVVSAQEFAALQRSAAGQSGRAHDLIAHLLAMPKLAMADDRPEVDWLGHEQPELAPRSVDFA